MGVEGDELRRTRLTTKIHTHRHTSSETETYACVHTMSKQDTRHIYMHMKVFVSPPLLSGPSCLVVFHSLAQPLSLLCIHVPFPRVCCCCFFLFSLSMSSVFFLSLLCHLSFFVFVLACFYIYIYIY